MGCLDDIRVASPCSARWSQMKGDDRVRFCGLCRKNVYDFSRLSEVEIRTLLARDDRVCARLWRRPDGKLLTADCPIGLARARARVVAAVLTAASFFLGFFGVRAFGALIEARYTAGGLEPLPQTALRARPEAKDLATFGQNNAP